MESNEEKALSILLESQLIPIDGDFEITEELLFQTAKVQSFIKGNKYFYCMRARKYAGISLMQYKRERGIKSSSIPEGFVYLIENPAWPGFTKIGLSIDIENRLSTYQTSDPHRAFKVSGYEFVLDRKKTEKEIIENFSLDLSKGEWVENDDRETIIKTIRTSIDQKFIKSNIIHRDIFGNLIKIGDLVAFKTKGYNQGIVVSITEKNIGIEGHFKSEKKVKRLFKSPSEILLLTEDRKHTNKYIRRHLGKI